MLTVVFGAGASYDSSPDEFAGSIIGSGLDINRPPLAKDLFSTRFGEQAQQNEPALALFPSLRKASNIEQELEAIFAREKTYPPVLRQLLSMRYYIRDVIQSSQNNWNSNYTHGVTTYRSLLDTIDRARYPSRISEKVALITFNYDTLLDLSCSAVLRVPLTTIQSYVDNSTTYSLFKPHGSIDWLRKVTNTGENTLDSADKLVWTNNYVKGSISYVRTTENTKAYITDGGEGIFVLDNEDYIPAIAIPTETKKSFEFPEEHKKRMITAIQETTALLVIGWRGAEKHFLELWKTHADPTKLKLIQIVSTSPNSAGEINGRLRDGGIICPTVHYSFKGFSGFVAEDLQTFLIEASHC